MSMNNNDQSEQHERIVAYLDGELSPEEGAQVEQQLATDQEFRQQLQGAERAWAALDELPTATVSDEFARTTMELVVDAARQDVDARTIALPIQRRQRSIRTALLATMALLLGTLVFRVGWQNPNTRLIADLPVIQNIDIYSQFRSIDFLQQLQGKLNGKAPFPTADAEQLQEKLADFQLVSSTADREDWLELLPADAKVTLRAKYNRFRDLSPERQSQLRELHQQILAADESQQLQQTMFRYQQWLSRVPSSLQYQLRDLPADERARHVAREMQRPAPDQRFELTPKQLRDLREAVQPMLEEIFKSRYASRMHRGKNRQPSSADRERLRELFFALKDSPEKMEQLNDVILQALPKNVREEFEPLPPWERGPIVVRWLRQARSQAISARRTGKNSRPGEISEQELADFFVDEISAEQKEQLLALPNDQMQQRLRRLYRGEHEPNHRRSDRNGGERFDRRPPEFGPGSPRDRREGFRGPPGRGQGGPPRRGPPSDRDRPHRGPHPEQETRPGKS